MSVAAIRNQHSSRSQINRRTICNLSNNNSKINNKSFASNKLPETTIPAFTNLNIASTFTPNLSQFSHQGIFLKIILTYLDSFLTNRSTTNMAANGGSASIAPGAYNNLFSSNSTLCNLSGADSPGSSNSSSRTRLVGLQNDSGLSTLSSNNGSNLLLPSTINQAIHLNSAYGSPEILNSSDVFAGMNVIGGLDELEDLEPIPRDRCNTWPSLRRPNLDMCNTQTSPLIHELIPEEESDESHEDNMEDNCEMHMGDGLNNMLGSPSRFSDEMSPMRSDSAMENERADSPPSSKKSTTRRNAWGNMSYADLITRAILNSPEKRLTLSQGNKNDLINSIYYLVYEWMVQNVPYFRDKGDSNSSAGWKVSCL